MPWHCPACHSQIKHSETDPAPRIGAQYRCPICRLELVIDPRSNKLIVAPLEDDQSPKTVR
jgi:hypothetical protein